MMRRGGLLALVCALMLGACSTVTEPLGIEDPFAIPQPFKGVQRNDSMIGQAIQLTALVVAVPGGIAKDRAEALRDRLVEVAQAHDVPALASASVRAWLLKGQAAQVQAAGKGDVFMGVFAWRLVDPDGVERAHFSVAYKSANGQLDDTAMRILAEQTATALEAALLRPSTQATEAVASVKKPVAWIGTISGAPGDGNLALARALAGVLPMKGVLVDAAQEKAEWRIEGQIKVAAGPDGKDVVTLTWRVRDAKGREAGNISQENAVPHGRLQKPWAEIAGFAAEAAAEGIAQLLQQLTDGKTG